MSRGGARWRGACRRSRPHIRTRRFSRSTLAAAGGGDDHEGKGLPAVTKQAQLVEIMGRHLADAVAGGATPQEAMDAAAAELKELL